MNLAGMMFSDFEPRFETRPLSGVIGKFLIFVLMLKIIFKN